MTTLVSDLRHATRRLRRAPGFLVTAVLTLSFGIGASTAAFSVVDPLLLRKLPIPNPDQLVMLKSAGTLQVNDRWWPEAFNQFAAGNSVLAGTIGVEGPSPAGAAMRGRIHTVQATRVTTGFFDVLGLAPQTGRFFAARDGSDGASAVVLGHAYWTHAWHADAGVVGGTLLLDGTAHTVLGVAPKGFHGLVVDVDPDVYVVMRPETATDWMLLFARLRPDVSPEQARAALDRPFHAAVAASGIPRVEHPQALARLIVEPAARGASPTRDRRGDAAWILMVTVAIVLLVACVNVANLTLAQLARRQQDLAVRRALGASRSELVRPVVVEMGIIAAMGTSAGMAMALWMGPLLASALAAGAPPTTLAAVIDVRVFIFAIAALGLAMTVSGLLPSMWAARANPADSLGRTRTVGFEVGARRWPRLLVVAQMGLSVTLIAGATSMTRSLVGLLTHDVGFDASRVLAVSLADDAPAPSGRALGDVALDLMRRLSATSDIESVGYGSVTPISGTIIGVNVRTDDDAKVVEAHTLLTAVSPGYFATLGVPLLRGRDFDSADVGSAPVAIVNQTLAARLFGSGLAIGRRVRFVEGNRPAMEIVGVVDNSTFDSVREDVQAALYSPVTLAGARVRRGTIVLRSSARSIDAVAAAVDREVRLSAPDVVVTEARTLRSRVVESIRGERLVTIMLAGFGGVTLAVTAVGLFGVLTSTLARRTREIGLRIALGATRRNIARLLLVPVAGMLAAGMGVGIAGTLFSGRLVANLLFEVAPSDLVTFVAVGVVLSVAAFAACVVPVSRATRIDPGQQLREP